MAVSTCDAKLVELHTKCIEDMQKHTWQDGTGRRLRVDRRQWRVGQQVSKPGGESSIAWWKAFLGLRVGGAIGHRLHRWFNRRAKYGLQRTLSVLVVDIWALG